MAFDYKEKFSVAGKKCIVTGAAQGLSRGMAEGLLENGAEVVLMDLQAEKLQAVADEYCKMGYKAHAVAGDLSKKPEIDRMFAEAMEILGNKLDVDSCSRYPETLRAMGIPGGCMETGY